MGETRSIPEAAEGILPAGRKAKTRVLLLVIVDVVREQPFQMAFIERDDVVQQVPAAASHPALGDAIRLWVSAGGPSQVEA